MVAGSEARQLDDLRWLGLDWDEGPDIGGARGPYRQTERTARYAAAVTSLAERGLAFRCDCSRAEIARVASAPHAGDDGPRYPGTCRPRGLSLDGRRRPTAIRLATPAGEVVVDDAIQGTYREDVAATVGDVVLQRGDGVFAYQLVVVVDDLAMGITEIVRGADLLSSSARQAVLARLLGGTPPAVAHVPLVLAPDGSRLAKRAAGVTLRDHRDRGTAANAIVGQLAHALGLVDTPAPVVPQALLDGFDRGRLAGRPSIRLPAALLFA